MTLYFLDDVFLLHLTLKASECVFEGFSLLQPDFCQRNDTPKLVRRGLIIYCKVRNASQGLCGPEGRTGRPPDSRRGRRRYKKKAQKFIFSANCTWRGGKELVAWTGLVGT